MASSDALRHVTIGQYIPTGSFVHRLDPRTKLVGVLLLIIAVVVATTYAANFILFAIVLGLVALARLPLGYILASVKPALGLIIVLALLQLLFYGSASSGTGTASRLLVGWGMIQITTAGVRMMIASLLRFLDLLFLMSLLTNTTTTSALTHGVEWLLHPWQALGLPSHELALVGAIALRFVPILGEQLEAITQAQASRRVSAEAQGRFQVLANARRLANLVVPLFVDAYRRSEEIILAMQARCYRGGKGRTHLTALAFETRDYLVMVLATLVVAAVIWGQRLPLP